MQTINRFSNYEKILPHNLDIAWLLVTGIRNESHKCRVLCIAIRRF